MPFPSGRDGIFGTEVLPEKLYTEAEKKNSTYHGKWSTKLFWLQPTGSPTLSAGPAHVQSFSALPLIRAHLPV